MMLARYSDVYLEEAFGPHSDGTLYEFEIIQYMTATMSGTDPIEGIKDPTSKPSWLAADYGNMGDTK